MANALDAVLELRRQNEASAQFKQKMLANFANTMIQKKQQNRAEEISLAKGGLSRGDNGQIIRDEALESPTDRFITAGKVASAGKSIYDAGGPRFDIESYLGSNPQETPQSQVINSTIGSGGRRPQVQSPDAIQAPVQGTQPDEFQANKLDAFGRPTGFERVKPTAAEEKEVMGLNKAKRMSLSNMNLVTGAIRELSQTYADGYEEGGIGDIGKKAISSAAEFVGGDVGDKFENTAAFSGQKTEVVARLMPLLTQQGEKEGSVRLVQAVFDKLEQTLPNKKSGPKSSRKMMEKTIRNMYRFTRASQMLGLTNESVENMSDDDIEKMSFKVKELAGKIDIVGEESKVLDDLVNKSLSPIDNLLIRKAGFDADDVRSYMEKFGTDLNTSIDELKEIKSKG